MSYFIISLVSFLIALSVSTLTSIFVYDFFHTNFKRRFARNLFYVRGFRKVRLTLKNKRKTVTFIAFYDYEKLIDFTKQNNLYYFIGADYDFDSDQFIEKRFFVNEIESVEDITGNEFSYKIKVDDPTDFLP